MNRCSLAARVGTDKRRCHRAIRRADKKAPHHAGQISNTILVVTSEIHLHRKLHFARVANLVTQVIGGDRRGVIGLIEDVFQVYL